MKSKHVQYPGVAGRGGLALTPVLAAGAVLLLAACAGTPSGGVAGAEECVYVRVTGSNLPVKECRSREEREAIAAANEQAVQNSVRDIQLLDEVGDRALGADSL